MSKFINTELEWESELESDTELGSVRIWFWIVVFFYPHCYLLFIAYVLNNALMAAYLIAASSLWTSQKK